MILTNIKTLLLKAMESKLKGGTKNVCYDYSHNGTQFFN